MFKGKLIGVLEVQEARGDRICQDALQELKTAIKASGEHKQRILIHIAVDGLKIRDEKTGVRHFFYDFTTGGILQRLDGGEECWHWGFGAGGLARRGLMWGASLKEA